MSAYANVTKARIIRAFFMGKILENRPLELKEKNEYIRSCLL